MNPDFDILTASSLDFTNTVLPNRNVLREENLLSHFTKSESIPIILESLDAVVVNFGIASSVIIFNFGNFLERTKSAKLSRVVKSFTIIALNKSELTASAARSYSLSQDSFS